MAASVKNLNDILHPGNIFRVPHGTVCLAGLSVAVLDVLDDGPVDVIPGTGHICPGCSFHRTCGSVGNVASAPEKGPIMPEKALFLSCDSAAYLV